MSSLSGAAARMIGNVVLMSFACVFAEVNSIKTNNIVLISHERTGEMSQVASFHPWVSSDNKMVKEKWKLVKQQH